MSNERMERTMNELPDFDEMAGEALDALKGIDAPPTEDGRTFAESFRNMDPETFEALGRPKTFGEALEQAINPNSEVNRRRNEAEREAADAEKAEARGTDLLDVKEEAFRRMKYAKACSEKNRMTARTSMAASPSTAATIDRLAEREDWIEQASRAVGTLAEVGLSTGRRLRNIDSTLERIAAAMEHANEIELSKRD